MSLKDWENNIGLVENISKAVRSGHIPHAIIVEGDSTIDKLKFAKDLLKGVFCLEEVGYGCDDCILCNRIDHDNYEDIYYVDGEKIRSKNAAYVEDMYAFLGRKASAGSRSVLVINGADNMTTVGQNKILKSLEEPSPGFIIILLSENVENLLDTIRSRCVIYRISSLGIEGGEAPGDMAQELAEVLLGDEYFHQAKTMIGGKVKDKDEALRIMEDLERVCRDYLLDLRPQGKLYKKEDLFQIIQYIEEAKEDLRRDVNPSYALKNMLLKIGG